MDDRRLAQQPRDAGQRFEVIGAGAFGRQQEKIRSTGWPSSASKSIGRSSRANSPNRRGRFAILPWGMAMPLPMAVEPSFSRCIKISKMAFSLWPESTAARAASSCSACFLLLTLSAGRIAFGATRSLSGMEVTWKRK